MEPLLVWGLVLLAAAVLITVIEIFVPSGGVLALVAVVVAGAGVVCLWQVDGYWGLGGLLGAVVLLPTIFITGVSLWTSTKAGRRAIGMPTEEELEARRMKDLSARKSRESLIGREGVVLTELRPVGTIDLDGKRIDALAEVGFIPAGARVRVVGVDSTELKVRQV
jgi:membrane-bound ClpP family serine protease